MYTELIKGHGHADFFKRFYPQMPLATAILVQNYNFICDLVYEKGANVRKLVFWETAVKNKQLVSSVSRYLINCSPFQRLQGRPGTLSSRLIVTSVFTKVSMLSVTSTRMQIYCNVSRHHHLGTPEKVVWYEWDSYFKPLYKSIVGITQFHHFIISTDCVKTKKFADSEEVQSFKLLLLKPIDPEMPKVIQPAGLSLERQWCIYHNLRSLVSDISKVDIVAPLPKDLPSKKREAKTSEDVLKSDEEPGPSSSGSTRKKISRKTTTKKNT